MALEKKYFHEFANQKNMWNIVDYCSTAVLRGIMEIMRFPTLLLTGKNVEIWRKK